jgi:hypothetical protein
MKTTQKTSLTKLARRLEKTEMDANRVKLGLYAWIVAVTLGAAFAVGGCAEGGGGGEGDRCNPFLSHNECDNGLTCQTGMDLASGATCGESYCCPTPANMSSNGFCNGAFEAPLPDGALVCPVVASSGSSSSSAPVDGGDGGTD